MLFLAFSEHIWWKSTLQKQLPTGGAAKLIIHYRNYQLKMTREIISFFTHNFENYELNLIRAIITLFSKSLGLGRVNYFSIRNSDHKQYFTVSIVVCSNGILFQISQISGQYPYEYLSVFKKGTKKKEKNGQNGTLIHCLAPNSELIFDLKKTSSKFGPLVFECHHYRDSKAL